MKEKNYLFSAPTLILFSIGIIALMGFAFIAFEGGRIYVERQQLRRVAADTASAICADKLANPERVLANQGGFGHASLVNDVTVYNPPVSGMYAGDENYIEVAVSGSISGGLVDLASADTVSLTGQAVVYCEATESSEISLVDFSQ